MLNIVCKQRFYAHNPRPNSFTVFVKELARVDGVNDLTSALTNDSVNHCDVVP